ncbi:Son of sevenless 2 [Allomyces arbusculus]|nr:Son of sevenless 2 [Allomyces arbusculus]
MAAPALDDDLRAALAARAPGTAAASDPPWPTPPPDPTAPRHGPTAAVAAAVASAAPSRAGTVAVPSSSGQYAAQSAHANPDRVNPSLRSRLLRVGTTKKKSQSLGSLLPPATASMPSAATASAMLLVPPSSGGVSASTSSSSLASSSAGSDDDEDNSDTGSDITVKPVKKGRDRSSGWDTASTAPSTRTLGSIRKGFAKMRAMITSTSTPTLLNDKAKGSNDGNSSDDDESIDGSSGGAHLGIVTSSTPELMQPQNLHADSEEVPDMQIAEEATVEVMDHVTISVALGDSDPQDVGLIVSVSGHNVFPTTHDILQRLYDELDEDLVQSTLYYFDPRHPGLRVEVGDGDSIDMLLHQHKTWKIIPNSADFSMTATLPGTNEACTVAYDRVILVGQVVDQLKEFYKIAPSLPYGLYVTSEMGAFLLESHRPLALYDIRPMDVVELRSTAEFLYVRVHVPELDTRFVVKAPAHFTGKDLTAQIQYTIRAKNATLQHPDRQYAIWMPRLAQWLMATDTVGTLAQFLSVTEIHDCGVEYKLLAMYAEVATRRGPHMVGVAAGATVADVQRVIDLDDPSASGGNEVGGAAMFGVAGDELPATDTMWDAVRQIGCPTEFVSRARAKPLQVTTTRDLGVQIVVEIDLAATLADLVPMLARRLGVWPAHVRRIYLNDASTVPMVLDRPLDELLVGADGDRLVVELNEEQWRSDGKALLDAWEMDVPPANAGVWSEGPDRAGNIKVNDQGVVTAATLNKLIERMTVDKITDFDEYTNLTATFLLTYHSFASPKQVLAKLMERYHVPRFGHQSLSDYDRIRSNVQSRVCNVLKLWTKQYPTCFFEPAGHALIEDLLEFTARVMAVDKQAGLGKQIRRSLFKLSSARDRKSTHAQPPVLAPLSRVPRLKTGVTLFHHDPVEVARQLCLADHAVYRRMKPTELLGQAWMHADAQTRAPTIFLLTKRFNALARWLTRSVLAVRDVAGRGVRVEWIVEVAGYLAEYRDYLALMAILAALGGAPVSRLKYTRAAMSSRARKKLGDLEEMMHPKHSHKRYREQFRAVRGDGGGGAARIPYLTVHLTDLVGIEDGNPDSIGTLINVAKRRLVHGVISDLLAAQDDEFPFASVPDVQRLLALCHAPAAPGLREVTDDELFRISLELEPRGWDGVTTLAAGGGVMSPPMTPTVT